VQIANRVVPIAKEWQMLRKVLVIVAVIVICAFGCKRRSSEPETVQEKLKTTAEYDAEAKEQINKENMAEELEKIEKAMEQEIEQEKR
jgi:hypothetical protein